MKIYPAIDLIEGNCVRLEKGNFNSTKVYSALPEEVALDYEKQGAKYLHVVDLDGAKAKTPLQTNLIVRIAHRSGLSVQTGGGIRTKEQIRHLIENGIDRVVIGSLAIREPELVREFLVEFGGNRITLALDVRITEKNNPELATDGWLSGGKATLWELLEYFSNVPELSILCTDIERDGMLLGPNLELYKEVLRRHPSTALQASGGVAHLSELISLQQIGCDGVIIGKALYENRFTLNEALDAR